MRRTTSHVERWGGLFVLVAAFIVGLHFGAWWTIPIVATLYAVASRTRRAPWDAMIGACLASLVLLARHMVLPGFPRLLDQLGGIFPVPGIAVVAITLLLAMLLAFTSARVAIGVVGVRD